MPEEILGKITIKVGDLVTTDHIMPAGSRLKYRSNVPKYSEFVFEPLDRSSAAGRRPCGIRVSTTLSLQGKVTVRALPGARRIVSHVSGRESCARKSIERIHAANLVNFGIVPLSFALEQDYDALKAGADIVIPGIRRALQGGDSKVKAIVENKEISLNMNLSSVKERSC